MKVRTYHVPAHAIEAPEGSKHISNSTAAFDEHRRGICGVNCDEESGDEYKKAHEWVYQGTSLLDEN